ncbi:MAG TPA: hypothetical protein VJJ78_02965 [Candidatus Saccharimonadales bacterium]|nr:hypothetical protein [Candidatus Saccharimonadales bacterium]
MSKKKDTRAGSKEAIDHWLEESADVLKTGEDIIDVLFPEPDADDVRELFSSSIDVEAELQQRYVVLPKDFVERVNGSCILDDEVSEENDEPIILNSETVEAIRSTLEARLATLSPRETDLLTLEPLLGRENRLQMLLGVVATASCIDGRPS